MLFIRYFKIAYNGLSVCFKDKNNLNIYYSKNGLKIGFIEKVSYCRQHFYYRERY